VHQGLTTGAAQLRLVHASPSTAAVDVYADSATTPLFSNLAFGQAAPYVSVPTGTFSLVLRAAGSAATSTPLFTSAALSAIDGAKITAVAGGQLGAPLAKAAFRISEFVEAFDATAAHQVRLRLVNLDYSLTSMGIDVHDDGTVEEANIGLYQASSPAGIPVTLGFRSLQLGLQTPVQRLTAFTAAHQLFTGGDDLFVIAAGLNSFTPRDARGLELIVVDSSSKATVLKQNPSLYLLNLIPDAAPLDLYLPSPSQAGQPKVLTALPFGSLSPAIQLPPVKFGFDFVIDETSTSAQPIEGGIYEDLTGGLEAGERYLMLASGFAKRGDGSVTVQLYRDAFPTAVAANGMIRGIAASQDAPALDIGHFAPGAGTPFSELGADFDKLGYLGSSAEAGLGVSSAPIGPGVRQNGTTLSKRFVYGALTDHAFGVVGGAWAPQSSSEQPLTFVVVRAANSGAWTASLAPAAN
jgi:hypothetical protein